MFDNELLDQLWYTWSTSGLGSMSMGYRVRAASEGLYDTQSLRYRRLDRFLRYDLPQGTNINEFDTRNAPISLSFLNNGEDSMLIRKVFVGRDVAGRNSVFFTHLIAGLPRDFTAREAILLWHCPGLWVNSEEGKASNDTKLPKIPYRDLITYAGQSQASLNFAPVSEQLKSLLTVILSRGMPAHIYASGQPLLTATLIYGITHCLPLTLLGNLTFSTYESNITESEAMIVGTVSGADLLDPANLKIQPTLSGGEPVSPDIQRYAGTAVSCLATGNTKKLYRIIDEVEKHGYQSTDDLIELFNRRFKHGPLTIKQMLDMLSHPDENTDDLLDQKIQKESIELIINQRDFWEKQGRDAFTKAVSWLDPMAQSPLHPTTRSALQTYMNELASYALVALRDALLQIKDRLARNQTFEMAWAGPRHCGDILSTLAPPAKNSQIWHRMLTEFAQRPLYDQLKSSVLWEFHSWMLEVAKILSQPQPTLDAMRPWLDISSWEKLERMLRLALPPEWEHEAIAVRIQHNIPEGAIEVIKKHEAKFYETLQHLLQQGSPGALKTVVQFFTAMVGYGYPSRVSLLLFLINSYPEPGFMNTLFSYVGLSTPYQLTAQEIEVLLSGCRPEVIAACGRAPWMAEYIREYILSITPGKLNTGHAAALLHQLHQLNHSSTGASPSLPDYIDDLVSHWYIINNFMALETVSRKALKDVVLALQHVLQAAGDTQAQTFIAEFIPALVKQVKTEHDLENVLEIMGTFRAHSRWDILARMASIAGAANSSRLNKLTPYLLCGIREHARAQQPPAALDAYLQSLFKNIDKSWLKNIDSAASCGIWPDLVQQEWEGWRTRERSHAANKHRQQQQPQANWSPSEPPQSLPFNPSLPSPMGRQPEPLIINQPAAAQARHGTSSAAQAPKVLAIVASNNRSIYWDDYEKMHKIMLPLLPYWSDMLTKRRNKDTSKWIDFEIAAARLILTDLEMKQWHQSTNLVKYLVCDVLIDEAIKLLGKEDPNSASKFNVEMYVGPQVSDLQNFGVAQKYQQLWQSPLEEENAKQALRILNRRYLFALHLESQKGGVLGRFQGKGGMKSWMEKEWKSAQVHFI